MGGAASDFLCVFVAEVATSLVCVSIGLLEDEVALRIVPVSWFLQSADSLVRRFVGCRHATRFMDESLNSTVQAVCFIPLKLVLCCGRRRLVCDLVE